MSFNIRRHLGLQHLLKHFAFNSSFNSVVGKLLHLVNHAIFNFLVNAFFYLFNSLLFVELIDKHFVVRVKLLKSFLFLLFDSSKFCWRNVKINQLWIQIDVIDIFQISLFQKINSILAKILKQSCLIFLNIWIVKFLYQSYVLSIIDWSILQTSESISSFSHQISWKFGLVPKLYKLTMRHIRLLIVNCCWCILVFIFFDYWIDVCQLDFQFWLFFIQRLKEFGIKIVFNGLFWVFNSLFGFFIL